MTRRRGIVLEVRGRWAIVLDDDGLFRRVPAATAGWQPGDEVWLPAAAGTRLHPRARWALAAACAALLAAAPLGYEWHVQAAPAAVVSVDISPSVELTVNGAGRVVGANAVDADGARLLAEVRVTGLPLGAAIAVLAGRAAGDGLLPAGGTTEVVMAAAPVAARPLPPAVVQQLASGRQGLDHALAARGYRAEVATLTAQRADEQAARALGLSLGRYLVYQAARAAGVDVAPADLRHGAIASDLARAGASAPTIAAILHQAGAAAEDVQTERGGHGAPPAKGPTPSATPGGRDHGQGSGKDQGQDQVRGQGKGQAGGRGQGQDQGGGPGGDAAHPQPSGARPGLDGLPQRLWRDLRSLWRSRSQGDERGGGSGQDRQGRGSGDGGDGGH